MNADNKYVRFDWAVKRMLRDKANFGVLEGRAEGRAEGRTEVAAKMKAKGISIEDIIELTGLTAKEIESL